MSRMPTVVAVGGLDPCGGAGVLADARAIAAAEAWPAAVTALQTVQATGGLSSSQAVAPTLLRAQLLAVLADLDVRVMKTGALGGVAAVQLVRALLPQVAGRALVVDPVMWPSRSDGAPAVNLAGPRPVEGMRMLAEVATLLTPNLPEAARLLGVAVIDANQAPAAAEALRELGPQAVLLKGGHAAPYGPNNNSDDSPLTDWLATAAGVVPLHHPRQPVGEVHGSGCVLASLIAGRLARRQRATVEDEDIRLAVRWASRRFQAWFRRPSEIGRGMRVLAPPPQEKCP